MKQKIVCNRKRAIYLLFILGILFKNTNAQISEGKLYKENSSSEVFVIHDGKKVHIPTPEALLAMGYKWTDVNNVTDGALANFPKFSIPSASPTPGSLVTRPFLPGFSGLWPVRINTTQRVRLINPLYVTDIHLVEIRGWIKDTLWPRRSDGHDDVEGDGDHCFNLIPDWKWLDEKNIDISKVIMVGNIADDEQSYIETLRTSDKFIRKFPAIHCEISSWGWKNRTLPNLAQPPSDWQKFTPPPRAGSTPFPFNPSLNAGQYVSVFGSLVMDGAHTGKAVWSPARPKIPREIFKWCPAWPWACAAVDGGIDFLGNYIEIHPVDSIQQIDTRLKTETTFGILLTSNVNDCDTLTVNLYPDESIVRPPNTLLAFREIIGPEWLDPNKNNPIKPSFFNPQFIRAALSADHLTVTANTCGDGRGSHGRIRALYSLWWKPMQRVPHEMNITINPFPLNINRAVTFIVTATDKDLNTPVTAEIFYNNKFIGNANSAITYTFNKIRKSFTTIEYDSRNKPRRVTEYRYVFFPLQIRMAGYISISKELQ